MNKKLIATIFAIFISVMTFLYKGEELKFELSTIVTIFFFVFIPVYFGVYIYENHNNFFSKIVIFQLISCTIVLLLIYIIKQYEILTIIKNILDNFENADFRILLYNTDESTLTNVIISLITWINIFFLILIFIFPIFLIVCVYFIYTYALYAWFFGMAIILMVRYSEKEGKAYKFIKNRILTNQALYVIFLFIVLYTMLLPTIGFISSIVIDNIANIGSLELMEGSLKIILLLGLSNLTLAVINYYPLYFLVQVIAPKRKKTIKFYNEYTSTEYDLIELKGDWCTINYMDKSIEINTRKYYSREVILKKQFNNDIDELLNQQYKRITKRICSIMRNFISKYS